jgi:hypothetical protein
MTKNTRWPKGPDGRRNNQPPKQYQYPPGQSGNPAGRPPAVRSTAEIIKKVGDEERAVLVGGKSFRMPAIEALVRKLFEHSLTNPKLGRLLLDAYDRAAEAEKVKASSKIVVPGPNGEMEGYEVTFIFTEEELRLIEGIRDDLGKYRFRGSPEESDEVYVLNFDEDFDELSDPPAADPVIKDDSPPADGEGDE